MLVKGYVATNDDLNAKASGQLVINRVDGILGKRRVDGTDQRMPYIIVRPGLKHAVEFYAATHYKDHLVVTVSDCKESRFYWLHGIRREVFRFTAPSKSFEDSWLNLFQSLLAVASAKNVTAYNYLYPILLNHFTAENKPQTITVEGVWAKEEFIASLEWDPAAPGQLTVSSTLDHQASRTVLFAYHPLEAAHRAARKQLKGVAA